MIPHHRLLCLPDASLSLHHVVAPDSILDIRIVKVTLAVVRLDHGVPRVPIVYTLPLVLLLLLACGHRSRRLSKDGRLASHDCGFESWM